MELFTLLILQRSPNFELVSLFMFITVMYNAGYAVMFTVVVSGVFNFIATQFKVLHSELEGMVANAERNQKVPAGDIRTMRALLEGLSVCLPTLLICNAAENMATESAKLALAASTIDFVGSDLGFQKYLVMIIRQAQKSPRIKAGKCIDVSLLSFTKVLGLQK
ncbi:hypothetical protein FQR65_LT17797 [Abscondita terminalis]|nr:hypothetical protein FQR65_LT17797 [Abscondita terminalis]